MNWIKRIVLNLVLVAFGVALAIAATELVFRFTSEKFSFLPPVEPKGYVSYDPQIGYDITPSFPRTKHEFRDLSYEVWSNDFGCFDNDYNNETPFIYLTGDSFTWGWTPLGKKWGKQIEEETGVRTVTCGVNGYGTKQELIKTTRDLSRMPKPELIVVGYLAGNDPEDDKLFPHYTVVGGYRVPFHKTCDAKIDHLVGVNAFICVPEITQNLFSDARNFMAVNSISYNLLYRFYSRIVNFEFDGGGKNSISAPDIIKVESLPAGHIESVKAFVSLAKRVGAGLLFVLLPSDNIAIKSFLESEKVRYLDLQPIFSARKKYSSSGLYWDFDGHWNPAGNRLAGLAVAGYIVENDLIPVKEKRLVLDKIEQKLSEEFPL